MKYFYSLLLVTLVFATQAQRHPQTLVGNGVEFVSGFGGFDLGFAQLGGETVTMTGGSGALLINNTFYIGGYGTGMTNDLSKTYELEDVGSARYFTDYSHGGLMLGYIINPEGLIHFGISSQVGWGNLYMYRDQFGPGGDPFPNSISDNLFMAIPRGELELNITNWFKVNLGVGYQFTNGLDNQFYSSNDLDGMNYELAFMFGWFR